MKATADAKQLAGALAKSLAKRDTMPILEFTRITAADGVLHFTSTDLAQELTLTIPANVTTPGTACVPGDRMRAALKGLDGDVHLDGQGDDVTVKQGRRRYVLRGLPVAGFPEMTRDGGRPVQGSLPALYTAIGRVRYAVPKDDARKNLNALLIRNGSVAGATGHRLAICDVPVDGLPDAGVCVPADSLALFHAFCETADRADVGPTCINVRGPGFELVTRLSDLPFPGISGAIPKTAPQVAAFAVADVRAALDRLEIFCAVKKETVAFFSMRMTFNEGALTLATGRDDDTHEVVDATHDARLEIGIDPRQLRDALSAFDDGTVAMRWGGDYSALLFEMDGREDQHVVMPMRI